MNKLHVSVREGKLEESRMGQDKEQINAGENFAQVAKGDLP